MRGIVNLEPGTILRDGVKNWMVVGMKLRCVDKAYVREFIEYCKENFGEPGDMNLDEVQIIDRIHNAPNTGWQYVHFAGNMRAAFSVELPDGTPMWEPVDE